MYDHISDVNRPSRSQAYVEKAITEGMHVDEVKKLLGEPDDVAIEGIWTYENRPSTEFPQAPDKILVFIEDDRVKHVGFMRKH